MKKTLAALAAVAGVLLARPAFADPANPIFPMGKAHVLTLEQSKLVKGKGSNSQYYAYYGNLYSYDSYYYGVVSYQNEIYGTGPTYYKAASDYSYAAYIYYFYAYYYYPS